MLVASNNVRGRDRTLSMEIKCSELGVKDCDFTARGETAGEVVRQVIEHLETAHGLDMPDADLILAGDDLKQPLSETKPEVELIVERLREALNIIPSEGPQMSQIPIGRNPSE
jgi:predicted small metal-binding protein